MKKELLAILLLFVVVLTTLSLVSHSPRDPSVNHQAFSSMEVENLFGLLGAHLSSTLVGLLGVASFWIPFFLSVGSIAFFKGNPHISFKMPLAGALILMLSSASFLYITKGTHVALWGREFSSGGFIGASIASFLLKYTGPAGSLIVLIFFLIAGVLLTTGVSAFTLIRELKGSTIMAWESINSKLPGMASGIPHVSSKIIKKMAHKGFMALPYINTGRPCIDADKPCTDTNRPCIDADKPCNDTNRPCIDADKPYINHSLNSLAMDSKKIDGPPSETHSQGSPAGQYAMPLSCEPSKFTLPPLTLLNPKKEKSRGPDMTMLKNKGELLENKLRDFGVKGEIVNILPGPVITTFEYRPAPGVKISKIVNLTDDIALALSALSIRIIAPIPGKDV
ncbi:MAG: DNA translocase FtsK 4TM domain-containing protein, partial [Desulfamplus sp.]|nr:DNA translocase FtsK 4TM domain-containing protein [Desulfamplus sp.]